MSYTAEYVVHETRERIVYAQVEYDIEPASGDGWNEPREEAYAVIESVNLYQVVEKTTAYWAASPTPGKHITKTTTIRTELGEAPQWVIDIIEADDGFMSDLVAGHEDDGPCPDAARDARIDLELMERQS